MEPTPEAEVDNEEKKQTNSSGYDIERLLTVWVWLSSASRKGSKKQTSKTVAGSKNVHPKFLLHFLKHPRTVVENNILVSNPFCLLMTTPISAFHELVKRKQHYYGFLIL